MHLLRPPFQHRHLMLASSVRQVSTIVVTGQRPSWLQLLTIALASAEQRPFADSAAVLGPRNPGWIFDPSNFVIRGGVGLAREAIKVSEDHSSLAASQFGVYHLRLGFTEMRWLRYRCAVITTAMSLEAIEYVEGP